MQTAGIRRHTEGPPVPHSMVSQGLSDLAIIFLTHPELDFSNAVLLIIAIS